MRGWWRVWDCQLLKMRCMHPQCRNEARGPKKNSRRRQPTDRCIGFSAQPLNRAKRSSPTTTMTPKTSGTKTVVSKPRRRRGESQSSSSSPSSWSMVALEEELLLAVARGEKGKSAADAARTVGHVVAMAAPHSARRVLKPHSSYQVWLKQT